MGMSQGSGGGNRKGRSGGGSGGGNLSDMSADELAREMSKLPTKNEWLDAHGKTWKDWREYEASPEGQKMKKLDAAFQIAATREGLRKKAAEEQAKAEKEWLGAYKRSIRTGPLKKARLKDAEYYSTGLYQAPKKRK